MSRQKKRHGSCDQRAGSLTPFTLPVVNQPVQASLSAGPRSCLSDHLSFKLLCYLIVKKMSYIFVENVIHWMFDFPK